MKYNAKSSIVSFANSLPSVFKYIFYALGILFFYRISAKFLGQIGETLGIKKTQAQKDIERRKRVEQDLEQSGLSISYDQLHSDVVGIATALGTNPDQWWWQTMTEDEQAALVIIRGYTSVHFPSLEDEYKGFTGRRSLSSDLRRFLSSDQFNSIQNIVI